MARATVVTDKHRARSAALGRDYHADRFVVGAAPKVGVIMVGGSGVTAAAHAQRASTVIPLDATLATAPGALVFVFATAPYDIPFGRFRELDANTLPAARAEAVEAARARWNQHVTEELFALVPPALPIVLLGYSGGAALILAGAHEHPRCVGAGAIGGDGVSLETGRGPSWTDPAMFLYNVDDRVLDANTEVIETLEAAGVVACRQERAGDHGFDRYRANGSLGELLGHAVDATR